MGLTIRLDHPDSADAVELLEDHLRFSRTASPPDHAHALGLAAQCRFPGCGQRRDLHAHHVHEYHDGGPTTAENLVMLCPFHHGAVHRNGWVITTNQARNEVSFHKPGFRSPPPTPDGDLERAVAHFTEPFLPGSTGERMDLHLAVEIFLHNEQLAKKQQQQATRP